MATEIGEYLRKETSGWVTVDCTIGYGSHSAAITASFSPDDLLIGIDRDADALAYTEKRFANAPFQVHLYRSGFEHIKEILDEEGIKTANAFLFDLGFSSPQVDTGGRGFSFMNEGPLDMRMDQRQLLSAKEIIQSWSDNELALIFIRYGEEKFSRRIAKAIVRRRHIEPIETTQDLADVIIQAIPEKYRYQEGIHPATRVFQALRIVVNDELESLRKGLSGALERLRPGGKIAVLSYHSLEHRIVKELFRQFCGVQSGPPGTPELAVEIECKGSILTRKPVLPCAVERERNPRCRSAQLRVLQRA